MEYFNPKQRWGNFSPIPDAIMCVPATQLSFGAKCLYGRLCRYYDEEKGHAYPGYETLGEEVGVSSRQVADYIKELIAFGLITQVKRGLGLTAIYKFPLHPLVDDREKPDQQQPAGPDENGDDQQAPAIPLRKNIAGLKSQSPSSPSLKKQEEETRGKREEPPTPVPILTAVTGQSRADLRREQNLAALWRDMTGQKLNPTQAGNLNQWADRYAEQGKYSEFLEIMNQAALRGWKFGTTIEIFGERIDGKSVPRGPGKPLLRAVGRSREDEQAEYAAQARKYKSATV